MKPQTAKAFDRRTAEPTMLAAAEDPHFGVGETTDDDDLTEKARRERADLWSRIADSFS